jgi:hypothetical protein
MAASSKSNARSVREALTAGTNVKEKGPPVADGILSVTPDTPEVVEWRSRSALDVAETSSTYLDDDEDGGHAAVGTDRKTPGTEVKLWCLQGPSHTSCMASSPGKLRTSQKSASGSYAATYLTSGTTNGESRAWHAWTCVALEACFDEYVPWAQVHPCLPPRLRCVQPSIALPVRCGLRQASPRHVSSSFWLAMCSTASEHQDLHAGWSHFAQFTIAVVNKDPKKSKYSGRSNACPCMPMQHAWVPCAMHYMGSAARNSSYGCEQAKPAGHRGCSAGIE